MRIAVLSDIHGNSYALREVLEDANRGRGVDGYWFLGDLAGYGASFLMCFKQVTALPIPDDAYLLGNHDLALIRLLEGQGFEGIGDLVPRPPERAVLQMHQFQVQKLYDQAEASLQRWLRRPTWSRPASHPFVVLSHGRLVDPDPTSPANTKQPIGQWQDAGDAYRTALSDGGLMPGLLLVGHSHVPQLLRGRGQDAAGGPERWEAEPVRFNPLREPTLLGDWHQSPVLINPGSVGQPRDGIPCAAYTIIDLDNQTATFRRVCYDIRAAQRQMEGMGLDPFLIERLWHGW